MKLRKMTQKEAIEFCSQLDFFDYEEEIKKQAVTKQKQKLRLKYGDEIVKSAFEI